MTSTLRPISGWADPSLPALMDIYQQSFPPDEQTRLSKWVRLLTNLTSGSATGKHLLVWERGDNEDPHVKSNDLGKDPSSVLGFVYYEDEGTVNTGQRVAFLWYLATDPTVRGKGIGAMLYQTLISHLFMSGFDLMLFEVEIPAVADTHGLERGDFARRRIAWYQRNGAQLLEGIHYLQDVGWQPPMEMHLMVHTKEPMTAEATYSVIKAVLGDEVSQVASLGLSPRV